MKYILFKTSNAFQALVAAAICSSEIVQGLGLGNDLFTELPNGKSTVDFIKIAEAIKKTVTDIDNCQLYVLPDIELPKILDSAFMEIVVVDNVRSVFESLAVSTKLAVSVIENLGIADRILYGLVDDTEIVTEEIKKSGNVAFLSFCKLCAASMQSEDLFKFYATLGLGKINLITNTYKSYVPVTLSGFNYYRGKEHVHYCIQRDIEAGQKVAIYRDNTGESNGESLAMLLFVYGADLPAEFMGLEFKAVNDPFVQSPCRVTLVPFDFWSNVMSKSKLMKSNE